MKFINLEQNGIDSWDEIVGFRHLPALKRLTLSKNHIKEIYFQPGFNELVTMTIEDNFINDWASFDNLNKFKKVGYIRCGGNPIME